MFGASAEKLCIWIVPTAVSVVLISAVGWAGIVTRNRPSADRNSLHAGAAAVGSCAATDAAATCAGRAGSRNIAAAASRHTLRLGSGIGRDLLIVTCRDCLGIGRAIV